MAREEYVSGVIAEFGQGLGMQGLALDASGQLSLDAGDVPVTFSLTSEPADLLWLHLGLGEVAADDRETLSYLLRLGQLLWARNLMTIGLDDEGTGIYGFTSIPVVTLTAKQLTAVLQAMLESALEVRRRLRDRDYALVPEQSEGEGKNGWIQV